MSSLLERLLSAHGTGTTKTASANSDDFEKVAEDTAGALAHIIAAHAKQAGVVIPPRSTVQASGKAPEISRGTQAPAEKAKATTPVATTAISGKNDPNALLQKGASVLDTLLAQKQAAAFSPPQTTVTDAAQSSPSKNEGVLRKLVAGTNYAGLTKRQLAEPTRARIGTIFANGNTGRDARIADAAKIIPAGAVAGMKLASAQSVAGTVRNFLGDVSGANAKRAKLHAARMSGRSRSATGTMAEKIVDWRADPHGAVADIARNKADHMAHTADDAALAARNAESRRRTARGAAVLGGTTVAAGVAKHLANKRKRLADAQNDQSAK
jgi:hypothetical protein